jgi:DNA ligase-4
MKFLSFFKVGGGFRAEDYANIKHHTEGKWIDWDKRHPPSEFIALGGPHGQAERPDVWIHPSDSVVLEVKAASVDTSDSFKTGYTLRFPRFKRLRMDKDCKTALSVPEFIEVKRSAEADANNKEMKVDSNRRQITKRLKKEIIIAGNDSKVKTPYAGPKTTIFEGLTFCVLSDMLHPTKKSKAEIEQILKSNGGTIVQSPTAKDNVMCIGDKRLVKVASLIKSNETIIVKPAWVLDALKQADIDGPGRERYLIPFEPCHMFHTPPDKIELIEANVDPYGDSYMRDVTVEELKERFDDMIHPKNSTFSTTSFLSELEERGKGLGELRGSMFRGLIAWFSPIHPEKPDTKLDIAKLRFTFAGGIVTPRMEDDSLTHILVVDEDVALVRVLREKIAGLGTRRRLPRIVMYAWLEESWKEGTVLDEEGFAVVV